MAVRYGVKLRLFGNVSDDRLIRLQVVVDRNALPCDRTPARTQQANDHSHSRRFPGPVRTQKADDLSRRGPQGKTTHCRNAAVRLEDVQEFQHDD